MRKEREGEIERERELKIEKVKEIDNLFRDLLINLINIYNYLSVSIYLSRSKE